MNARFFLASLALVSLGACAPSPTAPTPNPPPAPTAAPVTGPEACAEHPANSPAHCECLGGYVKGDIGDGQVACAAGDKELERTSQGIEGAVCCKKAEGAVTSEVGALCNSDEECGKGKACFPEKGCDGPQRCGIRPEACTMDYSPVCGCNGKTYGNACGAAGAGEAIAATGECEAAPTAARICGTRGAAPCEKGEFCDFPLEANCGYADKPGTCKPIPQACTREYKPVCGCDKKTYPTRCVANSSSVGVLAESACK